MSLVEVNDELVKNESIKEDSSAEKPSTWINGTNNQLASESILAKAENIFVSRDNVYIVNYDYEKDASDIYKFSIKEDGKLVGKGSFSGKILNQFSLDEYDGNLRVAITTNFRKENSESHIIVLDKNLNEVGRVDGLGRGEVIHSVRFMGERGYVVTFKNTDPLYMIDLKNPKDPKILGEIKVSGVSKYLYHFDENTLIGFGEDRDENNYDGLKISLFSVENEGRELFNEKIKKTFSHAIYNHKQFFFNKENSIMGFDVRGYEGGISMVVYKVSKETGFNRVIEKKFDGSIDGRIYGSKDAIYIILGDKVVTYDSKTFEKIGES